MSNCKSWTGNNPYDPTINSQTAQFLDEGICQRRIQDGAPSIFVHWKREDSNCYTFFAIVSAAEDFKKRLSETEVLP